MPDSMRAHYLTVPRTARYHTLGPAGAPEVWVVLHGYGQLAAYFLRPFRVLDDGRRRVVAPEALSRFYLAGGDGRVGASWMTREDRRHDIADYVGYLDAVLAAEGPAERVVVLGFSQGTATATRWVAQGRVRPHRVVLWAGDAAHDLDADAFRAHLGPGGLTLVAGTADPYLDAARLTAVEARLRTLADPFHLVRFDGDHRVDPDTLRSLAVPA